MTDNYVDSTGLVTQSLNAIVAQLTAGFQAIYGTSINVDPTSPDGQMINLFAQAKIDILDCISQVYGSFSPSSAIGTALDQRCAINNVFRNGATSTTVNVITWMDRITHLYGVNDTVGTPFTVADNAGNQFYLLNGFTGSTGANTALFQSATPGAIQITAGSTGPNGASINKVVTLTLGVTGASNSTNSAVVTGTDDETDPGLRNRRYQSVALPSTGYINGLMGALLDIGGVTGFTGATGVTGPTGVTGATASPYVTSALVWENTTNATDSTGTPAHSIWCIVDGGNATDIAYVIYYKRNAGCGTYGSTSVSIMQLNGFAIPIYFSYATYVNLYIALTVTSLYPATYTISSDVIAAMKATISTKIIYGINQKADYSAIAALVKSTYPYVVIETGGVGLTGGAGNPFLAPATIDKRWIVSSSNIAITVA